MLNLTVFHINTCIENYKNFIELSHINYVIAFSLQNPIKNIIKSPE
jgi:hypothetical protein